MHDILSACKPLGDTLRTHLPDKSRLGHSVDGRRSPDSSSRVIPISLFFSPASSAGETNQRIWRGRMKSPPGQPLHGKARRIEEAGPGWTFPSSDRPLEPEVAISSFAVEGGPTSPAPRGQANKLYTPDWQSEEYRPSGPRKAAPIVQNGTIQTSDECRYSALMRASGVASLLLDMIYSKRLHLLEGAIIINKVDVRQQCRVTSGY